VSACRWGKPSKTGVDSVPSRVVYCSGDWSGLLYFQRSAKALSFLAYSFSIAALQVV
jgi:hypothetical protein